MASHDAQAISLSQNPDVRTIDSDPNYYALAQDIRNVIKLNDALQQANSIARDSNDPSLMQLGVIEAFQNILNRDLFSNPPQVSALPIPLPEPPIPLPIIVAKNSFSSDLFSPPPSVMPPIPSIHRPAPRGFTGPPLIRIDTTLPSDRHHSPNPVDMALREALIREQALQQQLEDKGRQEEARRIQMEAEMQANMQAQITGEREARMRDILAQSQTNEKQMIDQLQRERREVESERRRLLDEMRKVEDEKKRMDEEKRLRSIESMYRAGDLPASKITESALFKVPGVYEDERKKQRQDIVRQRERDFELRLRNARNQGNILPDTLLGPAQLNWSVGPERVRTAFDKVGGPIISVGREIVNDLVNRINKAEINLQDEKRTSAALNIGVASQEREVVRLEKERDKMVDEATRMNTDAEVVAGEVHNLQRVKEDTLSRLERKKLELLELKKESTGSSDSAMIKRRELEDMMTMMQKLTKLKSVELYRNKISYEHLEKDYEDSTNKKIQKWAMIRKKDATNLSASALMSTSYLNSVDKSQLTESRLVRDPSYVTYYNRERNPRSSTNITKTLGKGEGSRFLADFNRDMDSLLNNISANPERDLSSRSFTTY